MRRAHSSLLLDPLRALIVRLERYLPPLDRLHAIYVLLEHCRLVLVKMHACLVPVDLINLSLAVQHASCVMLDQRFLPQDRHRAAYVHPEHSLM